MLVVRNIARKNGAQFRCNFVVSCATGGQARPPASLGASPLSRPRDDHDADQGSPTRLAGLALGFGLWGVRGSTARDTWLSSAPSRRPNPRRLMLRPISASARPAIHRLVGSGLPRLRDHDRRTITGRSFMNVAFLRIDSECERHGARPGRSGRRRAAGSWNRTLTPGRCPPLVPRSTTRRRREDADRPATVVSSCVTDDLELDGWSLASAASRSER